MSSNLNSSAGSDQREAPQGIEKDDMEDDNLGKLPAHIQSVRDGLLDFSHFMGLQALMMITEEQDEDVIPLLAYKTDGVGKAEQARESEFVESAQRLAASAQSIDREDGYEWHKLFRAVMTGRIDSICFGSNVQKSIAWADSEIWRANVTSDPRKPSTTIPTPGLYVGFSVPKADQRPAKGFRDDSLFNNYTREQLDKLTTQGLHYVLRVPSSVDYATAQMTSKEPQPQLVCFPWAIFKAYGVFKSSEANDISYASVVSQVSAAASSALSMFERLAKFAEEKHDLQHIPPVIAITLIGANATVWLAYCDLVDDKIRDHKMINIWEGTITKIWDAIQFCRIIDNLLFWAQNCLKPKVTQYLSQWRLRYCLDIPNHYSLFEMDTRIADTIHQIQDRLSSLGLSPNEDLPALVRQAVVFQEVMRSSNKEIKTDPTSNEEKKFPALAISLPSYLRDTSLEATLSRSTESGQGNDPKISPRGTEIHHQDSDFLDRKGEKGTAEPSNPYNIHKLQQKSPPNHQEPFLVFPDKGKRSISENSTVLEDIKATSTDVLTNKQTLKSKSPPISKAEGKENNKVSFSNPRQTKISNAEERKPPLPRPSKEPDDANLNYVQRTLLSMRSRVENGHVLSLEMQKSRNLCLLFRGQKPLNMENPSNSLPRKDSNKEASTDPLSSLPNPFVSETFELSFEPMPWLDLDMVGPRLVTIHRNGPYPTLRVGPIEHREYPWRTVLHSGLSRIKPVIIEPLPPPPALSLRLKIPWKGKHIVVRLPPINPASVSPK